MSDVRYISTICIFLCVVTLFCIPLNITFNIGYIENLEHMYFVSMKVALIKAS